MDRFLKRRHDRKKKVYDRDDLQQAYLVTLSGTSVYKAARLYGVPEQTLRDRVNQKVNLDCKLGGPTLFTVEEEKGLVDHITYMASIGSGYSMIDLRTMALEYAKTLGKEVKSKNELSVGWFYRFMTRWEELKYIIPKKLY